MIEVSILHKSTPALRERQGPPPQKEACAIFDIFMDFSTSLCAILTEGDAF